METISFTDAIEALQTFLFSKGLSGATHKCYLTDVKMFWEEMNLQEIHLDQLENLAAMWLTGRRRILAPKTTHRRLTSMKNLGLAFKIRILDQYRAPTPAPARPHPLPGGVEDLEKLLLVCHAKEHEILIALMGLCGARISEARGVRGVDFNFADRTVRLWGKGDKIRWVPISDRAWQILLPILVEMFSTGTQEKSLIRMGDRTARETITRLGERAGIARQIASHDLRATFATLLYRKTKDIRLVQELLGHASSKQTELYIEVDESTKQSGINFM